MFEISNKTKNMQFAIKIKTTLERFNFAFVVVYSSYLQLIFERLCVFCLFASALIFFLCFRFFFDFRVSLFSFFEFVFFLIFEFVFFFVFWFVFFSIFELVFFSIFKSIFFSIFENFDFFWWIFFSIFKIFEVF